MKWHKMAAAPLPPPILPPPPSHPSSHLPSLPPTLPHILSISSALVGRFSSGCFPVNRHICATLPDACPDSQFNIFQFFFSFFLSFSLAQIYSK